MLRVNISINPASSETLARVQCVKKGKPCIVGTRIAVEDVAVMHFKLGYSLVEIAGKYDLSLASVYAAMADYFDNRDEIDRRTSQEDELVEVIKQNHPSLLQEKLRQLRNE